MKILNIRLMGLVTVVVVLGLSCSESVVTDIDGNSYRAVKIGDQWWMAENLRVTRYRNGDTIPNITDNKAWSQLTTGALCNYDNDPEKAAIYGLLYTWYAVIDSRGIAPEGWHVPSDAEWKQLEISLGMSESEANKRAWRGSDEGGELKENGTLHWDSPNTGANNESGFCALPSGTRNYIGSFGGLGGHAAFWSSTEYNWQHAWFRNVNYSGSRVSRSKDSSMWVCQLDA